MRISRPICLRRPASGPKHLQHVATVSCTEIPSSTVRTVAQHAHSRYKVYINGHISPILHHKLFDRNRFARVQGSAVDGGEAAIRAQNTVEDNARGASASSSLLLYGTS